MEIAIFKKFENPAQAYLLKGMLEEEGIPAMVSGENNPYAGAGWATVNIWIKKEDFERVRKLMIDNELFEWLY